MKHTPQAEKLLRSYNGATRWADADRDSALQEAVDFTFPMRSDEERADLYARLKEGWSTYKAGTSRKLFVTSTIQKWHMSVIHGGKR